MKVPVLGIEIDERFLTHRQRSTSIGGMAGAVVAGGLFLYRLIAEHVRSWDLFAVLAAMVVVKLSVLLWSRYTD